MKKRILLIFVFAMALLLCGCCLSHEWVEASCTTPRTCSKCEKTEGDTLEHQWKEATCQKPKTCTGCDATEGAAKGHTLVEANYQVGEHCADCSEVFGEPVVAEFERTGRSYQALDLTTAHSGTYEYTTGKNKDTQAVTGKVSVNWAIPMDPSADPMSNAINCYVPEGIQPEVISIIGLNSCMEDLEGYQWRGINAGVKFSEQRFNIIWGYEDYYSLTQYDKDAVRNDVIADNTNGQITSSIFSVEVNGETYDQCMMLSISWIAKNNKDLNIITFYRVPENYDGCVFSLIDSRVLNHINYTSEAADNGFTSYEAIGHGAGDIYFRLK